MLQEEVSTAQVRAALHQAADGGCPVEGLQPVQPPQQSTPGPPAHDAGAHRLPWGGEQDDELLHTKHQLQICRVSQDFHDSHTLRSEWKDQTIVLSRGFSYFPQFKGKFQEFGKKLTRF